LRLPMRLHTPLSIVAASLASALLLAAGTAGDARSAHPAERFRAEFTRPDSVPNPEGNEHTPARSELGRALFFDTRLSGSGDISCATCHVPEKAWGDGRPTAVGTRGQVLGRRTPTVLNTAYAAALFWDGRAETLEQQALGPIQASGEMDLSLDAMVARLRAIPGYRAMFKRAYGDEPSSELVGKAIANFERTIVSAKAPFDRWVEGEESAISESAKNGFVVFNTRGGCAQCHSGWRTTDDSFHDIGVPGADSGRAVLLPDIEPMRFAFKTPTLRNVVERAPYMHDGSEATLDDVIDLYDRGGRVARSSISPFIKPLALTKQEKQDLVAFLRSLSSRDPIVHAPALPR
jgi:cytochrome c peroxidase